MSDDNNIDCEKFNDMLLMKSKLRFARHVMTSCIEMDAQPSSSSMKPIDPVSYEMIREQKRHTSCKSDGVSNPHDRRDVPYGRVVFHGMHVPKVVLVTQHHQDTFIAKWVESNPRLPDETDVQYVARFKSEKGEEYVKFSEEVLWNHMAEQYLGPKCALHNEYRCLKC